MLGDRFREAVVELYLDGRIGLETLKELVDHQDAEAVRASERILDQSEKLADELADL